MNSQLLYQEEPNKLDFEASLVEILTLPDERKGAVLDHTYFYPTGGGQEHDTGALGSVRVVDVFKDEEHSRLVHVVEGEEQIGPVQANRVIYEDRIVKTYIVSPEELQSIPLRRPPKVTENIRIVEIDGLDYSPCGGAHVLPTARLSSP